MKVTLPVVVTLPPRLSVASLLVVPNFTWMSPPLAVMPPAPMFITEAAALPAMRKMPPVMVRAFSVEVWPLETPSTPWFSVAMPVTVKPLRSWNWPVPTLGLQMRLATVSAPVLPTVASAEVPLKVIVAVSAIWSAAMIASTPPPVMRMSPAMAVKPGRFSWSVPPLRVVRPVAVLATAPLTTTVPPATSSSPAPLTAPLSVPPLANFSLPELIATGPLTVVLMLSRTRPPPLIEVEPLTGPPPFNWSVAAFTPIVPLRLAAAEKSSVPAFTCTPPP